MPDKPYREMFRFWLNINDDDEFQIAELISRLKKKRKYTESIRNGLRLICDLENGGVDVLFELYPWIKAEFMEGVHSPLQAQLERIEKQLNRNPVQGLQPLTSAPKPLAAPEFELPRFDDDQDESLTGLFKVEQRGAGDEHLSFLESMKALKG